MSQKSLFLSEINTSTFRGHKFNPGPIQISSERELKNFQNQGPTFYKFEHK